MSLPEINTKPQVTVREYTDENGNSITEKTTVEDNKKQTVIITEKIIKEMTGDGYRFRSEHQLRHRSEQHRGSVHQEHPCGRSYRSGYSVRGR